MLVMVLLQELFHRALDLMRIFEIEAHHPQRVADEVCREVIVLNLGIVIEQRAFGWIFDMLLDRNHALGLHHAREHVKTAQKVAVIGPTSISGP